MSLNLLLDENIQSGELITLLQAAGHDVQTTTTAGLNDKDDDIVLAYAHERDRVVLTFNCHDFRELDMAGESHFGIIGVYQYNNKTSDMEPVDIVNAIANLESSGWNFAGQFVSINQWHCPAPPTNP